MLRSRLIRAACALLAFTSAWALAAAPVASTSVATNLTVTSALLNGSGLPNGEPTTGWFRVDSTNPGSCNDTFGARVPAAGGTDLGSGTASVAYSITATGLVSGTTYFFCAVVENASGKAFGLLQSFTVPAAPITQTNAATDITTSFANLQGEANPVGSSTTGWFRYGTTDPGTCNDTFGTRTPTSGGAALGGGSFSVGFIRGVSGLLPGATYWYCAIASNAFGTTFGAVRTFTTQPVAPSVATQPISPFTSTTATLNGTVNPGGAVTTAWFRYDLTNPGTCNDAFGIRTPATGGTSVPVGNSSVPFSQTITGLLPNTSYFVCAIAENSVGKSLGTVAQITTSAPPTTVTSAATSVTESGAVLNGSGNPNRASTTAWFRYSATNPGTCDDVFGSRAPTSGSVSLGSGPNAVTFSQTISGLSVGVTYYFCAIAANSEGVTFGAVLSFTTTAPPTAVTNPVTGISPSAATLSGAGDPNGNAAFGYFRWGTTDPGTCSDSFGSRLPTSSTSDTSLGSGSTDVTFTRSLTGLSPNTTYYVCAAVRTSLGTAFGEIRSFTTGVTAPTVSTSAPTLITGTTATLNGAVNPGGASTTAWFRYATVSPGTCNDTFGTRAPSTGGTSIPAGSSSVSYSQPVTGLVGGTTYYVCAVAQNSAGKEWGAVETFTTPLPPTAVTLAATGVTNTTAGLQGQGNPNRASTTGWFRFGTTNPGTCSDTFGSRSPPSGGTALGSGTSAVSFNQSIGGLSPNTTYFYCAVTQSSEGTAFGGIQSFVTPDAPTVSTTTVSSITSTTASFAASGDPNGASATGYFRLSTSSSGPCLDSFGVRVPTSSGTALGSGTDPVPYTRASPTLSPATTYWVCAAVQNAYGTAFGPIVSFTTLPSLPVVSTLSPSPFTGTTATLQASVNPGGAVTSTWFRYSTASPGTCNDTFGVRAPTTGGVSTAGNAGVATVTQNVTGLVPSTTYFVCAISENAAGQTLGSVVSFVTAGPPTATTGTATFVADTSVVLNGSGNPNLATSTGWFRFGTTNPGTCSDSFGSRAPSSGGSSLASGSSAVSFSQSVAGLSPDTTYYFCAVVQSGEGTAFGSIASFTTASVPVTVTEPVSSITAVSAVLNGTGDPNLSSSAGWFRYTSTVTTTCNDSFGTRVPTSSGTALGAGTDAVPFARSISGLLPATTYYVCAIVQNSYGTSFGAVRTFTTAAALPSISGDSATGVTGAVATLNTSVNPGGAATTVWFRYATASPGTCNDTFGTRAPTAGGTSVAAGNGFVPVSRGISGLSPGVTYYFCAIAENSVGTALGSVQSFVTPRPPAVTTLNASAVTNTSVTFTGSANPNGSSTTGWFRFGVTDPGTCSDTFGSRAPTTGGSGLGAGSSAASYSQGATGLTAGTTYFFCAVAQSSEGTSFGAVLSFTTASAPVAVTDPVTAISSGSATLNGTGDPNLGSATGWFRYGTADPGTCNDSFGIRAPSSSGTSLGSGTDPVPYARSISGLLPGTTYYACAIVQNTYGTVFGAVRSFTTPASPPTVVTSPVQAVTGTTVTLAANVNPGGAATSVWFRVDTTSPATCNDTFGTRWPATGGIAVPAGTSAVVVTQPVTGLSPGVEYFYCAIAENSAGLSLSPLSGFTTPLPPTVVTQPATSLTNTSATLTGTVNARLSQTFAWFRYAAVDPGTCNDTFGSRAPVVASIDVGSGNSDSVVSFPVNGLSTGVTYYFCAIAENVEGKRFGAVRSFTTLQAPTTVTLAASAVTATGATFNGSADPNGATTTGWHRYSTTNPGLCSDTWGTRVPSSSGTSLGAGTDPVPYSRSLTGLLPGTTYFVCAIAQNAYGTTFGEPRSFTTPPTAPTVFTDSVTDLLPTSATFNGGVTPGGASATGWFRYDTISPGTCNDTYGIRAPATGGVLVGSGNSSILYSQSVTGLTAGTTYYVCAIAENSAGKAWGTVVPVTTPRLPVVVTLAATPVTATSAQLNASSNPNSFTSTGWFRISSTEPTACNDTFGTRVPATGGSSLGSGTTPVSFSQSASSLVPGTTYWFCGIVSNSLGTVFGEVLSFTTPAAAPTTVTLAATGVGPAGATFEAVGNPNGATTIGWFRYGTTNPGTCTDSFGTRFPATGGVALGAGSASVPFEAAVTGLALGQTYFYCSVVQNSVGSAVGGIQSFVTTGSPTVVTSAPSGVTASVALLQGSANPNAGLTTGWFRYGTTNPGTCNDTFGTRAPTSGGTDLGSGVAAVPYSRSISGLSAGTTYFVCAIAQNASGVAFGEVVTFTTPAAPAVVTLAASDVTGTTATLSATGNPRGANSTGWFRLGTSNPGTCSDSFGARVPALGGTDLGAGSAPVPFDEALSGLSSGTTYFACAVAQNSVGTSFGAVVSFQTPAAPTVITRSATNLTPTGGTLVGTVTPNLSASVAYFRYGASNPGTCSDAFGTATAEVDVGAGAAAQDVSADVSGLTPGTVTWYCAVARNAVGTSFGAVLSLETPGAPTVVTSAPAAVTASTATLQGTADPNGAAATGWFRYDTADPGVCSDAFGTRAPASGGSDVGSGTNPVAFNQPVTGLAAGTTYWYCAIASNAAGVRFGSVRAFVTPSAPVVSTEAITGLAGTSVTLNGLGNPRGASTTGWFRYDTTHPGVCSDTFGTRTPVTGGTALGSGDAAVPFSRAVSGLASGTTYHACALASNAAGLSVGAVISFTTPSAPTVVTRGFTGLGTTTATLQGTATPNGDATTGWFRYAPTNPGTCSDTFGTATAPWPLGSGTSPMDYEDAVTGLVPGTTYWFCAIARNSAGTSFGELLTFLTPAAPRVVTVGASSIGPTSATLEGSAVPNAADSTGWFRYGTTNPGVCSDTFGTRVPLSGGAALGSGAAAVPYSQGIVGLTAGTTYWFCAVAQNAQGIGVGEVRSFTTASAPLVVTSAAQGVDASSATLQGTANPRGAAAIGWFRYAETSPGSCSDSFGTRVPSTGGVPLGAGVAPVPFSDLATGLARGTTYWYCALASNAAGTGLGELRSFTTPGAPVVVTNPASAITALGATLEGSVNPSLSPTTAWFRLGTTNPGACTDSFGSRVPATGGFDAGTGSAPVAFTQAASGLQAGTTYWYCAVASNAVDVAFGVVRSFTTTALPVAVTSAPTNVSTTGATLQGSGTPNGRSATGWFRYSATNPGTCSDAFGVRAPASGGTALGAGVAAVPFSQAVSSLVPQTTYYACAIVSSSAGTSFGQIVSFRAADVPSVVTVAATALTSTSAELRAEANPRGAVATGWFRYGTTDPGACSDTFGVRAPATGGVPLGSGSGLVGFDEVLTGLAPGTTYYACAVASSASGTGFGAVLSFTTPAAPTVVTLAATGVASATATLRGSVTANGTDTGAWFRYASSDPGACNDAFGTRTPTASELPVGSGTVAVTVEQAVAGLAPGTTYYYCAIATNASGTAFGDLRTVTTSPAAPLVVTGAATNVGVDSATVNGAATPNGAASSGWFRYGTTAPGACSDTFGVRAPATGSVALGAGLGEVPFAQVLTGLVPGVTYHVCAVAENSLGRVFGAVVTFTPGAAPPDVLTGVAEDVTGTTVTLTGEANPNGASATGWFRYGDTDPGACDASFGVRAPSVGGSALGSGTALVPFDEPLVGLLPNATYWYCAAADSVGGATFGEVGSFTTEPIVPDVTTRPAVVTGLDVVLAGGANPNGSAAVGWFRYADADPGGCDDAFGIRVPATGGTDLGAGRVEESFSEPLAGLAPGTWFVCAIAENEAGLATGEVVTFVVSEDDTDAGDTDDTDAGDTDDTDAGGTDDTDAGDTDETDVGDTSSDGGGISPGCGCASSPSSGGLGVVLLGVAGAVLRRRRR